MVKIYDGYEIIKNRNEKKEEDLTKFMAFTVPCMYEFSISFQKCLCDFARTYLPN